MFGKDGIFMSIEENTPHNITLAARGRLTVSGVDSVESFDETSIVMTTTEGVLVITGNGLHIETLSLDGGDLRVEGTVDSLTYEDESERREGFLARIFRG